MNKIIRILPVLVISAFFVANFSSCGVPLPDSGTNMVSIEGPWLYSPEDFPNDNDYGRMLDFDENAMTFRFDEMQYTETAPDVGYWSYTGSSWYGSYARSVAEITFDFLYTTTNNGTDWSPESSFDSIIGYSCIINTWFWISSTNISASLDTDAYETGIYKDPDDAGATVNAYTVGSTP